MTTRSIYLYINIINKGHGVVLTTVTVLSHQSETNRGHLCLAEGSRPGRHLGTHQRRGHDGRHLRGDQGDSAPVQRSVGEEMVKKV